MESKEKTIKNSNALLAQANPTGTAKRRPSGQNIAITELSPMEMGR